MADERENAYDLIDRFLRCSLNDTGYAEYSSALDLVWGHQPNGGAGVGQPRREFPLDVLGNPMREVEPGKWESAKWPSAGAEDARDAAQWRGLCRRLYVELFHCDQQMTSGKRPKWKTGSKVKQVLDDASAALAAMSDQNKGKV